MQTEWSLLPDPLAWVVDGLVYLRRTWTLCLSTSCHSGQSDAETKGLPMQKNPDCSRVVQLALVVGSSCYVNPNPTLPAQPVDSAIQLDS